MSGNASQTATLCCHDGITSFSRGDRTIRFRTPKKLERYLRVTTWDNGYLVADAQYDGVSDPVEEYIDLTPILENLYIDPAEFLAPVKEVHVE